MDPVLWASVKNNSPENQIELYKKEKDLDSLPTVASWKNYTNVSEDCLQISNSCYNKKILGKLEEWPIAEVESTGH